MKKEIKSLILKANKGDPKSQHDLAFNYWTGKNLKQDSSEAMKWWKLSASKGFGIAYFNLGRISLAIVFIVSISSPGKGRKTKYLTPISINSDR